VTIMTIITMFRVVVCFQPVATQVLILVKRKVLTPGQAHVCHKFSQDIL
jgi:hypothetical protein